MIFGNLTSKFDSDKWGWWIKDITICKFLNKLKASQHVNKVVELFYEILV